jgi:hypothetical protein
MKNRTLLSFVVLALPLAGCTALSPSIQDGASLTVMPKVCDELQTQAELNPYTSQDIQHLVVALYKLNNGQEQPALDGAGNPRQLDVLGTNLSTPLQFGGLKPNSTYRLKASAYLAASVAEADLISLTASSSADVVLGNGNYPQLVNLPVQLKNRMFHGEATTSLDVHNGGITQGTETIY